MEVPPIELPGTPPELGGPTFFDLVAMIAEPVAIYLGDAELPDGRSMENLEMARLHIDLLDVLRQKTAGRLDRQEAAVSRMSSTGCACVMSRSGGEPGGARSARPRRQPRFRRWLALTGLPAVLLATGLAAQQPGAAAATPLPEPPSSEAPSAGPAPPVASGIELSRPVSQTLLHLQESWIQWMSALYQDHPDDAKQQVEDLRATLDLLGMQRLPELSVGAAVRATEAARQGNYDRAEWVLQAAERLDPGRPETAFARAVLDWERGSVLAATGHQLQGYLRIFGLEPFRFLMWHDLLLWLVSGVLLAGAAFVLLLLTTHGTELYGALLAALTQRFPVVMAAVVALLALVWPMVLPYGLACLMLYWSVLLWRFSSVSERVVLVVMWLVVGLTPWWIQQREREVRVALSPPVQAINALAEGRLYGSLFSDLGVLRRALPESPAVWQLIADVHRKIGQWEQARVRYNQVLESEPGNVPALLDLGAYFFRKGDYGNAVQLFQRAATADSTSAAAYFNLSQAYSESYLFDEQRQALTRARSIDDARVSGWIQGEGADRVVTFDGGVARRSEIRRQLAAQTPPSLATTRRLYLSAALPLVLLGLAFAFQRLGPSAAEAPQATPLSHQSGFLPRLVRVLVPGLTASEEGNGGRAFAAVLGVALLVLLLAARHVGLDLPLGLDPGYVAQVSVAVGGLVVFLVARVVWDLRSQG